MKRWLMISAAAVALSSGAAQADYTLHVLHINDFHSRVEPINKYDSTCDAETEAFSELLGVHVQRLATLAQGDHVCTTFVPGAHAPDQSTTSEGSTS